MRGTTFYRGREASLRMVGLWETLEEVRMRMDEVMQLFGERSMCEGRNSEALRWEHARV